jgi:hypothetical protein
VLRGRSWDLGGRLDLTRTRGWGAANVRVNAIGFRVVLCRPSRALTTESTAPRGAKPALKRRFRFFGFSLVRIHKGRLFSGIGKAGLDGFRCERRPFVF